jgi:hypothetical protein
MRYFAEFSNIRISIPFELAGSWFLVIPEKIGTYGIHAQRLHHL